MPYWDCNRRAIPPPSYGGRSNDFRCRSITHDRLDHEMHTRTAVLILMLMSLPAHAGVYKWTDAQGRVHYSDTAPPRLEVQRVQTGKTNEAEAAAARRSLADKLSESELRRKKAQEEADKRKAEEEKQRVKAENCLRARERLTLLQQNVPISRLDAQGQRYVMGETERMAAIQEAQRRAEEFCKQPDAE